MDERVGGKPIAGPSFAPLVSAPSWLEPYQQQRLTTDETLDHLGRSFDFLLESLDATRDRLDEPVSLGGQEWTTARLWVEPSRQPHVSQFPPTPEYGCHSLL